MLALKGALVWNVDRHVLDTSTQRYTCARKLKPSHIMQVDVAVEDSRAQPVGVRHLHDTQMAEAHFVLGWDGERGWLQELRGATGTLVDGERIAQAQVGHGSWGRAGSTDFTLWREAATPAPPRAVPEPPEREARRAEALRALQAQPGLWAVLDGARSERIRVLLREEVGQT